ncbi:MAG TPA: amino acid adenylation domain-containing protein [Longimicrobium sp.]|nr:amino acid adenylation domain-containing protein [Longimicrobium sp.]
MAAHALETRDGGLTPPTFPEATLSQDELDDVLAGLQGLPLTDIGTMSNNVEAIYPLSPMQEGMLFHSVYAPGTGIYVNQVAYTFDGLDADAFRRAWQAALDRHAALRSAFLWEKRDRPLQAVLRAVEVPWDERDWRGLGRQAQQAALEALMQEDRERGYALNRPPAMRLYVMHTADDEHRVLWSFHHLVLDGWSMSLLLGEVFRLYDALRRGESPALPPAPQYRAYITWLQAQRPGDAEAFWRGALAGVDAPTPLGVDHGGAAVNPGDPARYAQRTVPIPPATAAAVQAFARRAQLTANTVVQGAWALLLSRYGGSRDVVFGVTMSGRPAALAGAEQTVGLFINTLPARVAVPEAQGVLPWLHEVQRGHAGLQQHGHVPLVQVHGWSAVPRDQPLFETVLAFQNFPSERPGRQTGGLQVREVQVSESPGLPLTLSVGIGAEPFLKVMYDRTRVTDEAAARLPAHFTAALDAIAAGAERRVGELDVLPAEERARVVHAANRTTTAYPRGASIHALFQAQAAATPDAVALCFGTERVTYAQLDARANRVARRLRAMGVRAETRVAVCAERSPELVAALLGVLKAGGAYVPLDPSYPADRLAFMLRDCAVPVLAAHSALAEALPPHGAAVLRLDADAAEIDAESGEPLALDGDAGDAAYVMYTSGSTGRPKGIVVPHRGVVRLVRGANFARMGADEAWLQLAPVSFDAATLEIWAPLLNGGRLVLFPGAQPTLDGLERTVREGGVTSLWLTAGLFNTVVDGRLDALAGVRQLLVGGDVLSVAHVRRVLRAHPGLRLVNGYGPTENTTFTCCHAVRDGDLEAAAIPIGGPVANSTAYVLDAALRPTPHGVPGELYTGGDGVARGYLNQPALTAARFVPDPFSATPGARMYATGDRVRRGEDGALEFLGRMDRQVKVRGFRIEPGEVEAALRARPGVKDAIVATQGQGMQARLLAWVAAGPAVDEDALLAALHAELPAYMVPSGIVVMPALPLTPNGKVDRRALPDPGARAAASRVAPRNALEAGMAALFGEMLSVPDVGATDSFFALGGHSLLAMRLVSRVREGFGVELPLRALFDGPTVAEMAKAVEDERRRQLPVLPPVVPAERTGALPLSFAQERLWFIDRLEPGSTAYSIPVTWRLSGALDAPALERSLSEIVRRHESLRTVFREVNGGPAQVITPFGGFALPVEDLSGLGEADREAAVSRRAGEEARRAFDLAAGPLFRASLLRLGAEDHVLMLSMHHIVSDGWSMGVLVRELSALYAAYREGGESPLAELPVQYADYAVWQREQLAGELLERQLSYWTEQLAGAPELLELPTDRPRPPVRTNRGASLPVNFSPELLERLQALGRSEGATLYMTLLGAFQVLLSRYAGSDDVVVGSPIAGRTRKETEELIGFFVNTLVLRTDLSGDPSFREVLRRVRDVTMGAYEHQEVPFERLVAELQPERSLSHSPLFQVMFTLQDAGGGEGALPGLRVSEVGAEVDGAKFDLSLGLAPTSRGLRGVLTYSTDLFEPGTIERMVQHLERVLEQVAANAGVRLSQLDLLGNAERALVLEEWSRTEAGGPADRCAHELFAEQAERTPGAVAVMFDGARLTYAELDARANQLAHYLRALGVGPEVRVGLCVERSLEMVVGVLGVLKAGGAYVPLDPGYPAERLAFMLRDATMPVLLTHSSIEQRLPGHAGRVVRLDLEASAIAREPAHAPESGVVPQNLAYVIYTSGSTGRPKGAAIPHGGLARYLAWAGAAYGAGSGQGSPLHSSLSFDLTVTSLFVPLLAGRSVVLAPEAGVEALAAVLRSSSPFGFVKITPGHLSLLLAQLTPDEAARATGRFVVGGESLPAEVLARWAEVAPEMEVTNEYGPTETVVGCCIHTLRTREATAGAVPIGRPSPGTALYVLDGGMSPCPIGVPGELYIGGGQLGRGYLGRPALTADRFVPDPFSREPGARMYRSGDRVRWLSDGNLEFQGRLDDQVKVRGFRIELGEIEAQLAAHEGVREARVVVREDQPGDTRLVAYVVGGVETDALRAHMRQNLPEYMVPGAFVVLEALPLTPNGKLDRKALPAPELAPAEERYVAPRTPVEEVLAGIWAEVLRLDRVGVEESFFDLGGHSLLATRVMSRVRELFGVELPLRVLFEGATVAEMASAVEDGRRSELPVLPPVVPVDRTGALPLSFAQERLWAVDQMQGAGALYNVPMARRLEGPLDVEALRGALAAIVRRHEALRTVFREADGALQQVIVPFAGFEVPLEDLSGLDAAEREARVGRSAAEDAARPFDLSAGPLIRARLLRLGQEEHVLLLCMHHVVSDGWSMDVLTHELNVLYGAFREKQGSPLPELAVQYADYAAWHRWHLSGEVLERHLAYWRQTLAGAPALLALPTDHPRPAERTHQGAHENVQLPAALLERLRALGRDEGATLFMVLLGAFQALLSRYGGGEDVVVGSPIAGRTRRELEGLIGYFANTLVLRTDLGGDPAFRDVLRRVRAATLGAYEHQELPFDRLVAELQPERSLSHSPLFQVTFTFGDGAPSGWSLPGVRVSPVSTESHAAKFDLMLAMEATPGGLRAGLTYATDLFERGTIRRMLGHLERVLEQVAGNADVRLSELRLAGDEERALLAAGHATRSFPVAERLDQRFEARALERPDAPALTYDGTTTTYGELNERANRLAHRLRALGVGPEVRVGIVLERSAELIVAILAVLKAGGAYVPLDPSYPADRIAFVLEDARIPVLVTASGVLARLPVFTGAALCLDTDAGAIARESGENPGVQAGPDTLAYVIYTSGSTGKPKGVQVTHANAVRLFDATDAWFGFAADDVWTLFHSCAFDFSVWEIWGALLYGGRLVVVPYLTTRSPEDFHRLLADEGVTMLSQTPSAFKQLVQADLASGVDPSALRLRCVVFGGEALDPLSLRPWMERHGERPRLVNMYGITETTVHVTYRVITRADLDRGGSPIGVPIPDLSLYVLDAGLEPVPAGVTGELFVGGAGVARGYLNRPELTAERFIRDPFSADPAARLYRSGDLARRRADGELEYLGRADQQVKIRGFRIELGEIEAALMELPGIRDAAVLVRDEAGREKQLVAYVVLQPGEAEDSTAMRAALSVRLPEHMVPAVFVVLPRMPLTSHGKLDRRALPAPEAGRTLRAAYAAPASAPERLLQEVWQEVLGAEQVGVLENFFAAGGDSMRAVQMVAVLRRRGMALTVRDLFEEPTIRGLAARLDAAGRAGEAPQGGVPHHLADLAEEERVRVRAAFPAPVQDVYPATGMQGVMISEYARDTARAGVYHPQQCHRLTDASLSTDALRHAIEQVVRRHAIFRTVFVTGSDGTLLQVVRESASVPIGYQDLRGLSPDEQERAIRAGLAQDLETPFDPSDPHGSLTRFVIFHREDHVADLMISAHHAIEDGWGNVHFLNTLFEAYADARDGRPVSAAPLPNTYREFVALEAEIVASAEARAFWRDRLRDVSSPWPAPRGATGGSPGECRLVRRIAPELTAALRETAAREGVAVKALYLSAFLDVVAMLTGGEDACTGVVWNGRSERLSEPLTTLGLFWNLVPVARPATASGDAAGRALAVHHDLLEADRFGRYPLAEIMADRGGREPFFSTFNFLHFRNEAGPDAVRGSHVQPVYSLDRLHLPFNLAVGLAARGEGARMAVEYDGRFFSRGDADAALDSYLLRLEELTSTTAPAAKVLV